MSGAPRAARAVLLTLCASVLAVVYNNLDAAPSPGRMLRSAERRDDAVVPLELAVEVVDARLPDTTTPDASSPVDADAEPAASPPPQDDDEPPPPRRSLFERYGCDPIDLITIL